jgi:hypothetical protein
VYKGHGSRRAYLQWCVEEWRRNHKREGPAGDQTINAFVSEFTQAGAAGTCDILRGVNDLGEPQDIILFAHLLPANADELAKNFAEGLAAAIEGGFIDCRSALALSPFKEKAPGGNTGLTSPPLND